MRSIGDTLRKQRVRRGKTPSEAASDAGLPSSLVTSLESDRLSLDDVEVCAYLRIYARYLELDAEALLRSLENGSEQAAAGAPALKAAGSLREPARGGRWWRTHRHLVALALGVFAAVVAGALVSVVVASRTPTVELTAPPADEGPEEAGSGAQEPAGATAAPGPRAVPEPAEGAPGPEPPAQSGHRAPGETRVQVLHNNASPAVVAEVRAALESMGYQVVQVAAARTTFERTTVYFVDGWQAEAEALRDRDGRFAAVEPNIRFSTDVDLHVAVGADWPAGG